MRKPAPHLPLPQAVQWGKSFPHLVEGVLENQYLYVDFLGVLPSVSAKRTGLRFYSCYLHCSNRAEYCVEILKKCFYVETNESHKLMTHSGL